MRISDWSSDVCSSDLHGLVGTAPLLFDCTVESRRSEVIEPWIPHCPAQDPVELKARQRPGSVFSRIAQEGLQFDNWLRLTDTRIKLGELPLQFRLRCRRLGEPGRRQGVHPIDCRAQEAHCSCLKMSLSKPALGVVIKNRKIGRAHTSELQSLMRISYAV